MHLVVNEDRLDLGGNIRHGDGNTFCPKLWSYFIDRFGIRTMLDVGCGEGHAPRFFHNRGVIAHGIDGLIDNVNRSVYPIALHDILSGPYYMPVDFVWSCEVAEHIAPEKVDHYCDTLANGTVVAMTHAMPGQAGHHHVNCQPDAYWIDLMQKRGYVLDRQKDFWRAFAGKDEYPNYFQSSGLVFVKKA